MNDLNDHSKIENTAKSGSRFTLPDIEPAFDSWLLTQLLASPPDPKDSEDFKYITFTQLPPFTPKHTSLMCKYLTPELWSKLSCLRTTTGYSLSNSIQAGVLRPQLGVGFTAGDEESYELFGELLRPIIQDWHGLDPSREWVFSSDMDASKLTITPAQDSRLRRHALAVRARTVRNISGCALPAGAGRSDRLAVDAILRDAFASLAPELRGTYCALSELSPADTAALDADTTF